MVVSSLAAKANDVLLFPELESPASTHQLTHPDYVPEAVCLLHLGNRKLRTGGQLGPQPFRGAPQGPEQTSGPQIRLVPCSHLPNSEVGVLTFQLGFSGQYYFSW